MTKRLMSLEKKMILVLEGGYNLDSLGWASVAVANALVDNIERSVAEKVSLIY